MHAIFLSRNLINILATSSSGRPDRVLDLRIPVAEQSGDCGISIVGGSDTPLRGVFIQSLLPESPSDKVSNTMPRRLAVAMRGKRRFFEILAEIEILLKNRNCVQK
mgnify:CR=1 FL=1